MVSAARCARRERREVGATAALAREEIRVAERDALIARKRLEVAEEKHREALHRADRATVSLASAAPPTAAQRSAAPSSSMQQAPRLLEGQRYYYCGRFGVSTDSKCPNAAQQNKARPWFHYRD